MEQYEKLKDTLKRHRVSAKVIAEQIAEDPRKKKKKRKKSKKNEEDDMMVSFKPLGTCRLKDSQDSRQNPLPHESEFCEQCFVKFYNIQIEAVRWMYWIEKSKKTEQHVGGILGDVMGLGKTVDALGITCYDYFKPGRPLFEKKPNAPTLIITTLTLIHQWKNELLDKFHYPEKYCLIYHGAKRGENYDFMCERGIEPLIIITNYETVQKDFEDTKSPLFRTVWERILLDEAHIARNPKTNTYHALKTLKANAKWCITGTPIVNYPDDIRRLSQLCTPAFPLNYGSSLQESRWKNLFLLRRTKEMLPLPPMNSSDVWLEFTDYEKKNYSELEMWAQEVYDELVTTQTLNRQYQEILRVLVRLRQACDHFLLQKGYNYTSKLLEVTKKKYGVEDFASKKKEDNEYSFTDRDSIDDEPRKTKKKRKTIEILDEPARARKKSKTDLGKSERDFTADDRDIFDLNESKDEICDEDSTLPDDIPLESPNSSFDKCKEELDEEKLLQEVEELQYSAKINFIEQFLKEKFEKEPECKVVIFTQFVTMMNIIQIKLIRAGIKTLRFDGRVQKASVRSKIIETFTNDKEYKVILTSLKAGGVGLNLVAANYLLLVDPWWNSSVEEQAFDRVHRIGQKNPVHVCRLLIKGSIEEDVLKIQEKKDNQENSFYDIDSEKVLSIKDIHCVFSTMRVRQLKNNKQN